MAKGGHVKHEDGKRFCALRTGAGSKCGCGEDYVANSKVPAAVPKGATPAQVAALPAGSAANVFVRSRKKRAYPFEAHHLLCIGSLGSLLAKDPHVRETVKQTVWCVNAKPNMLAMPLWGHAITHYCDLASKLGDLHGAPPRPHFADIPMHNYNHNGKGSYKSETDSMIDGLAKDIKKLSKDLHMSVPGSTLAAALDAHSDEFRNLLAARGKRSGGTHEAWTNVDLSDKSHAWCLPFSMASDATTDRRPFPASGAGSDGKVAKKIASLVKKLKKWG